MKHFFELKSLGFYGGAIASVALIFSLATAYGENHLRAPTPISGRYPLEGQLPGCLQTRPLLLVIQQSGIYLTGSLLPADGNETRLRAALERPALNGRWDDRQLTLTGTTDAALNCPGNLEIVGAIVQNRLTGKFWFNQNEVEISSQKAVAPDRLHE